MWAPIGRADADRCLPVLLCMQGLRRDAQAVAGRLLRVLLLRHSALSTRADGTLRRVSSRDRDWVKTTQGYRVPNKAELRNGEAPGLF
jgi:hypothetical protein